jgi:hypothetical protein
MPKSSGTWSMKGGSGKCHAARAKVRRHLEHQPVAAGGHGLRVQQGAFAAAIGVERDAAQRVGFGRRRRCSRLTCMPAAGQPWAVSRTWVLRWPMVAGG